MMSARAKSFASVERIANVVALKHANLNLFASAKIHVSVAQLKVLRIQLIALVERIVNAVKMIFAKIK